jgi:hypothetical protein
MIKHTEVKLGKHPVRHDPRTLLMAKYVLPGLPPPPPTQDWGSKVGANWGMMGNDKIGDCTCAAAGHLVMDWTANTGKEVAPSVQQIVAA